jgi:hypothetical protein
MKEIDIPTVNVVKNLLSSFLAMRDEEVFLYPLDQVVFEDTLDELMQEVRRQCKKGSVLRKVGNERLGDC